MKLNLVVILRTIALTLAFILAYQFPAQSGYGYIEAIAAIIFPILLFFITINNQHLSSIFLAILLGWISILHWLPNVIATKGHIAYTPSLITTCLLCCWETFGVLIAAICGRWSYKRGGPSAAACTATMTTVMWEIYSFHVYPWSWGSAFGGVPWLAKSAALIGTHGITMLIWIFGTWIGASLTISKHRFKCALTGLTILIALLTAAAGIWYKLPRGQQHTLNVVMVQPNFTPGLRRSNMEQDMWKLSDTKLKSLNWPQPNVATLLLWPESSVLGRDDRQANKRMSFEAKSRNIAWLFGTEGGELNLVRGEVLGRESFIQAKVIPMPFGERMPGPSKLRTWLDKLMNFTSQQAGILTKASSFRIPTPQGTIKVHPIICSEATISNRVIDGINIAGGDILTNHTNDGWFEHGPTTDLHAAEIRLRAVETGLPLLRSTLTGKSGIFREDGSWELWGNSMTKDTYGFQIQWRPIATWARNPLILKSFIIAIFICCIKLCIFPRSKKLFTLTQK